jgi:glycosyltransferase involved in cell wall biosynthesis
LKRILAIAPQPYFASRGTPISVYYRTLVMAEQGATIDLLTYGSGRDVSMPGVRHFRIPRIRAFEPIPVGPSWKKFVLDLLMIGWTIRLLVRNRYEVVHAHEESVFWCSVLKRVLGFRLIYDMHSSLPQQLQNTGYTRSPVLIGSFRMLEKRCLRVADAVVTVCPDLRDYARSQQASENVLLIENSLFEDVHFTAPEELRTQREETPEVRFGPGHSVVLYAGTLEVYQGLDLLLDAFVHVVREVPSARLLIVGGQPHQVAKLAARAAGLGLTDACQLTGQVAKPNVARYVQVAQVLVSPRLTGTNTPLKIYELLASGRPLVATRIWSHTQVLDDSVCRLVEPDPRSLANGLVEALTYPEHAAHWARNACELYRHRYARHVYEEKIDTLMRMVAAPEVCLDEENA